MTALTARSTVQWAGCCCTDREHEDENRLDWQGDRDAAFDRAFEVYLTGSWHLMQVEVVEP